MKSFSKILVAHDFSEHARRAVEVATDLARRYDASLSIIHVQQLVQYTAPDVFPSTSWEQLGSVLLKVSKEQLEQAQQHAMTLSNTPITADLLHGSPVLEITRYARDGGFDLIVMGTHGRTGIARAVVGSVAERVVRTAPCAVLTVHVPAPKG